MNFTISKPNFSSADLSRVDPRILPYIKGWSVKESYEGSVSIPDYVVFNYFEALDKPEGKSEDEKQLAIWMGWAGRSNGKDIDGLFDAEVQVTLSVNGIDASDVTKDTPVNYEILKSGRANMLVYWNSKLVTDFTSIGKVYALVDGSIRLVIARYPDGFQFGKMQDIK